MKQGTNEMLLSIVIPMYNEEAVIGETCRQLLALCDGLDCRSELIFVNDGSRDGTLDALANAANGDKRVKTVCFARNFGHQPAVRAGLTMCSGDAAVIIDADLQDPPSVIPEMLAKWREGWDVVYGKRKSRQGETAFKKFTAFAFYRVLRAMAKVEIPADTGDFRLVDRRVIDTILSMGEHNPFLRGMVSWVGYRQCAVEYERAARFAGETKYPLRKMLKLAMDGIFSMSYEPIKLLLPLALALGFGGLVYFVLALALALPAVNIVCSVGVLLTAIVLACMYILGEYVGRVYDEALARPVFIISHTTGFDKNIERTPR